MLMLLYLTKSVTSHTIEPCSSLPTHFIDYTIWISPSIDNTCAKVTFDRRPLPSHFNIDFMDASSGPDVDAMCKVRVILPQEGGGESPL